MNRGNQMFNLKQIYFYLALSILLIPLYVQCARASAVIPNYIEITIMEESTKATIKRSLVVLLNKRVTENVLRTIAYKLKASDHVLYQRTFIAYNIKNRDTANGFWARTDFTPNLNVRIIGLTVEQAKESRIPQPKLYKTVYALFIDRNDYPHDEQYNDGIGQFRVLKNKPFLHIEINPTVVRGDILSYKEDTKKAVLYGIYKTFIHTNTNKIKVTATPRELTSKNKLSEFSKTVTITRATALKLVNKALGVSSFKELVTPSFYKGTFITYVYSDICKNILYNGKRYLPGLDKFFLILEQDIKETTQFTVPLVTPNQAVTLQ